MDVNYNVWGQPETWVDGNSTQQRADIKFSPAAQDTFQENYQNGNIPWNEIDLSLSYWGIGAGSIWAQPHLIYPYCPDGNLQNYEVEAQRIIPEGEDYTGIPAIFAPNNSVGTTYVSYTRRYKTLNPEEQTTGRPLGNSYTQRLFTSFNYQKVMVVPYVYFYNAETNHGSLSYETYKSFFDNIDNRIGYQILGIAYRLRYGDGETNRTSEESSFGIVWPVDYRGNTSTYDDKPYFAGAAGMSHLTETGYMTAGTVPGGIKTIGERGDATVGTAETGFRKTYCVNTGSSVPIFYYDDEELWEVYHTTYASGSNTFYAYYPRILVTNDNKNDVQDYLLKQISYLGLPFVIDPNIATRGKIGDTGVYLPKFDEDGVTTGEYEEGASALTLPNAEWVDGRTGSGYDPTKPTPGPGPEDSTDWQRNPTSTTQSGSWPFIGSTLYAMTQNRFNSAYSWMQSLYAECLEAFNEDRMSDTFWSFGLVSIAETKLRYRLARLSSNMNSQNYLDSVMSVMRYPFDVRPYLNIVDAEGIHWGSVYQDDDNSGIVTNPTTYEVRGWGSGNSFMVPGGTLHYDRYYGNFLDYAPYSEAELYIPYCGAVKLDPQVYCGHDIKVNYLVDFNSGACLALIYRDNLICDQISGQMGIPINFTAPDIQSYNNSIFNGTQVVKANQQALTYNLASNALEFSKESTSIAQDAAASYAKKDIAGMANALPNPFDVGQQALNFSNQLSTNLRNLKTAEYNLEHVQLGFKQISSSSTQTSSMNEQTVRLIVYRPTFLPEYRSSTGAADKYESDKFRTYAHTTGFACLINSRLNEFTGLTICGSVNTNNINATESEKNLLETALKTGVYL